MAKSKTRWPVVLGVAFIALFLGYMAYSTLGNSQQHCQVCVTFHGRTNCGSSASTTREQAERTALELACDRLGSGMTELEQCRNSPDQKVTCTP